MTDGNGKTALIEMPKDLKSLLDLARKVQDSVMALAEKATGEDQKLLWDHMKVLESTHDYLSTLAEKQASSPRGPVAIKFYHVILVEPEIAAKINGYYKYHNDREFINTGRRGFAHLSMQAELKEDIGRTVQPIINTKIQQIRDFKIPRTTPVHTGASSE